MPYKKLNDLCSDNLSIAHTSNHKFGPLDTPICTKYTYIYEYPLNSRSKQTLNEVQKIGGIGNCTSCS